MGVLHWNFPLT